MVALGGLCYNMRIMRFLTGIVSVFALELRALVRSRAVAMLVVASAAWMVVFPRIAKGDGTPAGLRELVVHFSLGGVFALLVVALLASATGSIARERAARRLQLTLVRPVRYTVVALGKIAAHVAVGAGVLALSCAILAFEVDVSVPCSHVLSPAMPSPREEAKAMYKAYMADTNTPVAVRQAKKSIVLRLLENRAVDRYQTIPTNRVASWSFPAASSCEPGAARAVRLRFASHMEMRQSVQGVFRLGRLGGSVSNITQAVLTVPLRSGDGASVASGPEDRLTFANLGDTAVMMRPRRDLNLLVAADSFGWNLLRAYLVLVAMLSLVVSIGVLLSACLGRPVSVFVAFVALVVGEISPSVVEQYPDELETKLVDRVGLAVTRFAISVTRPVSGLAPLGALARDECVEPRDVARMALTDILVVPLLLSLLASLAISRKHDDGS